MKFFLNDNEIKMVLKGATIQGNLGLVSRIASFSYPFCADIPQTLQYKAQIGSTVVIENDSNKKIFKGKVSKITLDEKQKIITLEAHDELLDMLLTFPKGRFKGKMLTVLSNLKCKFKALDTIEKFLNRDINIVNLGKLNLFEIIKLILKKFFGDEFKLYIDGYGNLSVLLPFINNKKAVFKMGKDIISAEFSSDKKQNTAKITAFGNDEAVSGAVIEIIDDKKGVSGHFLIEKDVHTFSDNHIMDLYLKERKN